MCFITLFFFSSFPPFPFLFSRSPSNSSLFFNLDKKLGGNAQNIYPCMCVYFWRQAVLLLWRQDGRKREERERWRQDERSSSQWIRNEFASNIAYFSIILSLNKHYYLFNWLLPSHLQVFIFQLHTASYSLLGIAYFIGYILGNILKVYSWYIFNFYNFLFF